MGPQPFNQSNGCGIKPFLTMTLQHLNTGHWRMRMLSIPDADDVAPRSRNHCCVSR